MLTNLDFGNLLTEGEDVILAVYNEDVGTAANDYLLPGTVELRGEVNLNDGSIGSDTTRAGTVEIKASRVIVKGKPGALPITNRTAATYSSGSSFRNNVIIARSTIMEIAEASSATDPCPRFDRLQIPAGVKLIIQDETSASCQTFSLGHTVAPRDHDGRRGIAVWNKLDIAGTLELQDDLSLFLNPFRPRTVADKAYGYPSARIDGTVITDSDSRFYIMAEPEVITEFDSLKSGRQSAVAAEDSVLVWVKAYTGWYNAPFYALDVDTTVAGTGNNAPASIKGVSVKQDSLAGDRYQIRGSGSIAMPMINVMQAGVDLYPNFGSGTFSSNRGGVLHVYSSSVDGHFFNEGNAQTEFMRAVEITRDMVIEDVNISSINAGGIGTIAATSVVGTAFAHIDARRECYRSNFDAPQIHTYDGTAWSGGLSIYRGLTTGVYFKAAGARINGSLELVDGDKLGECYGGVYALQGVSVGEFVLGNAISHFLLGDDLSLGRDFDFGAVTELVVTRDTAPEVKVASAMTSDFCKGEAPDVVGPHVAFTGSEQLQTLSGNGEAITFDGVGLRLAKSSSGQVKITDVSSLATRSVDIQVGFLTTNGLLDVDGGHLRVNQNQGSSSDVRRGTNSLTAYVETINAEGETIYKVPERITYTGSVASMRTGDELFDGMEVHTLEMYLTNATTRITLLSNVTVTDTLALMQGILNLPGAIALASPKHLTVGHATIEVAGGEWTTAQEGTITFVGTLSRTTGNIAPAYPSREVAGEMTLADVVVEGCASDKEDQPDPLTLLLQPGYTTFGRMLAIRNGSALDLAGNDVVIRPDSIIKRDSKGEISSVDRSSVIEVEKGAWLCDSVSGVPCNNQSDGAAHRDAVEALADALEAMHYDNTPDHRAAYSRALASYRASGAHLSKATQEGGQIYVEDSVMVDLKLETHRDRLSWSVPAFVLAPEAVLAAMSKGVPYTLAPPAVPNMADAVTFAGLTLEAGMDAATDEDKPIPGGRFEARDAADSSWYSFDRYTVMGDMVLSDHSRVSLSRSVNVKNHPQIMFLVGGGLRVGPASVLDIDGNYLAVGGDYRQDTGSGKAYIGGGAHYTMGDFHVGPNGDDDRNDYFLVAGEAGDDGKMCHEGMRAVYTDTTTVVKDGERVPDPDRDYHMVNAGLWVYGDYAFMGSADAYDDDLLEEDELGFRGGVTFAGSDTSRVSHDGPATQFCDVTIASADPRMPVSHIKLESDIVQSRYGTLTLKAGVIHGTSVQDNSNFEWRMHNAHLDKGLSGQITVPEDSGTVSLGSRDSYFDSGSVITRSVQYGNQIGDVVVDGYLFPVGTVDAEGMVYFRPLIIQFPSELGSTREISVSYASDMTAADMEWPEGNLTVDGVGGSNLILDNVADMFWKVEMDVVPAHDPNLRLVADNLPNVYDIHGLRIMQWDCDGTNPRLAGVYDVEGGGDPVNGLLNNFISGVPNLTQEGVDVSTCNIFGIASNLLENPISEDPITSGTARVQFIHNVAGATVDVYVNDNRIIDDFEFQTARAFGVVPAGQHTLAVVSSDAVDHSQPLVTMPIHFRQDMRYHVIAHGNIGTGVVDIVTREDVRTEAFTSGTVDFYFVHGASGLGTVDIRLIDPIDNSRALQLLANNLAYDDVGQYMTLDPSGYNFEITTSNNDRQIDVFRVDIQQYANLALVLNLSGPGESSEEGVTFMGVPRNGNAFFPQVITGVAEELPTEFALLGNYPNPFNPSTRIAFDLPESAQISVTVFDMLGRSVMMLPAQELEAGASRSVELDGSSLASGNYFYRVVAAGASGRFAETGRMMLIR